MTVTIEETEGPTTWEAFPAPEPDGVLRPAGEGLWVAHHPDGSVQFWRVKGLP
jgi:hypothetical protein